MFHRHEGNTIQIQKHSRRYMNEHTYTHTSSLTQQRGGPHKERVWEKETNLNDAHSRDGYGRKRREDQHQTQGGFEIDAIYFETLLITSHPHYKYTITFFNNSQTRRTWVGRERVNSWSPFWISQQHSTAQHYSRTTKLHTAPSNVRFSIDSKEGSRNIQKNARSLRSRRIYKQHKRTPLPNTAETKLKLN